MDVIDILALTLVVTRWVVLIPTMLYGLSLLQKYKNDKLFQHRNPSLICIITILTILTLAIERTFMISAFVWNIISVKVWIVYLVYSIFWWALFALFGIKAYNLYYQQQYNLSIADHVWKSDINPKTVDFYISNKHKWGSAIWLVKICLIPYIISCAADAVFPQFFGEGLAVDLLHSSLICPPLCVALYALYKARQFGDVWGIRNEALYQTLLLFFSFIIYTTAFCIGYTPHIQQTYGVQAYRFNWTLYSFLGDIGAVAFGIIPIFYPIYLIKKSQHSANLRLMSGYISDGDIVDSLCLMNKIMVKYHSFQLFMEYLVSEFTAENALFLIELIQIKHDYQKRKQFKVQLANTNDYQTYLEVDFNLNPMNGEPYKSEQERYFTYLFHQTGSIRGKISLPIEVAKSYILTENEKDLCKQMCCLYNKYVAVERLNISHKVREELDEVFVLKTKSNLKNEHMLFNVMDECAIEVLLLLQHSFARFICKDSFSSMLEDELENKNDTCSIRSDIKMKELLNSNTVPIVSHKELIVYHNF